MPWPRFLRPPIPPDVFAQWVMSRARTKDVLEGATYEPESFSIVYGGGSRMYLGNFHQEAEMTPIWSRRRVIDRLLSVAVAPIDERPKDFTIVRTMLLPVIRDPLMFTAPGIDPSQYTVPRRYLGDSYCVALVVDSPTSMSYVSEADLEDWDVPFSRAMDYAMDNLAQLEVHLTEAAAGLWISRSEDAYDCSRLLREDIFERLSLSGRPVVGVPNPNCFIVTSDDNPAGLATLDRMIREHVEAPRAIGQVPLVRTDEGWAAYVPSGHDDWATSLRALIREGYAGRYHRQKEFLDWFYEERGEDIFVANAMMIRTADDAETFSLCSWGPDVNSLLPRTDRVAVDLPGDDSAWIFPWQVVVDCAGTLMKPQGWSPERWKVCESPSPEQLENMKSTGLGEPMG